MPEKETRTKTGGTSGTGEPDATAETLTGTRPQNGTGTGDESLAAGDDSVRSAIGGGDRTAGTGSTAAQSGRATTEGGPPASTATDPGDPGGMGGVRTNASAPYGRPPGGVSPMPSEEEESGQR